MTFRRLTIETRNNHEVATLEGDTLDLPRNTLAKYVVITWLYSVVVVALIAKAVDKAKRWREKDRIRLLSLLNGYRLLVAYATCIYQSKEENENHRPIYLIDNPAMNYERSCDSSSHLSSVGYTWDGLILTRRLVTGYHHKTEGLEECQSPLKGTCQYIYCLFRCSFFLMRGTSGYRQAHTHVLCVVLVVVFNHVMSRHVTSNSTSLCQDCDFIYYYDSVMRTLGVCLPNWSDLRSSWTQWNIYVASSKIKKSY